MPTVFENCWFEANTSAPLEYSYTTRRYRRWWQFWKPRHWMETTHYRAPAEGAHGFTIRGSDECGEMIFEPRGPSAIPDSDSGSDRNGENSEAG